MRPAPKPSFCLTDVERQTADCTNAYGTSFDVKFTDKGSGKKGEKGFDKMVCIPGDQFVDSVSWVRELLINLTKGVQ